MAKLIYPEEEFQQKMIKLFKKIQQEKGRVFKTAGAFQRYLKDM